MSTQNSTCFYIIHFLNHLYINLVFPDVRTGEIKSLQEKFSSQDCSHSPPCVILDSPSGFVIFSFLNVFSCMSVVITSNNTFYITVQVHSMVGLCNKSWINFSSNPIPPKEVSNLSTDCSM